MSALTEMALEKKARVNGAAVHKSTDPLPGQSVVPYDTKAWDISRFAGEPPILRYLVKGLISLPSAGTVYGPGGVGKSTTSLELAIRIAILPTYRTQWLGHDIENAGVVVYFVAEDPDDELHRRLKAMFGAIAEELGVSPEEVGAAAKPNLLIAGQWGRVNQLFRISRECIEPTAEATKIVSTLEAIQARGEKIAMICFDTRSRYSGAEGSGNSNVSAEVSWFESLAQMFGSAVMIVHHTRKGAGSPEDAARGESSFLCNLRFGIFIRPFTDEEADGQGIAEEDRPGYLVIWPSKANYFAKASPFIVERDGFHFRRRDDLAAGRSVTKREAKKAGDSEAILEYVREAPGLTQQAIVQAAGAWTPSISKARTLATLAALETAGRITSTAGARGAKLYEVSNV